jgi:uncharacterized membrane protein YwzB
MQNKNTFFVKLIVSVTLLLGMLAPVAALAQSSVDQGLSNVGTKAGFPTGGLAGLTNGGPIDFFANVIDILLIVSGAVAVLFVVIGGFWFVTAGGSEEQAKKGRKTVVNAIIGIIIIILAYVIVNVVVDLVSRT